AGRDDRRARVAHRCIPLHRLDDLRVEIFRHEVGTGGTGRGDLRAALAATRGRALGQRAQLVDVQLATAIADHVPEGVAVFGVIAGGLDGARLRAGLRVAARGFHLAGARLVLLQTSDAALKLVDLGEQRVVTLAVRGGDLILRDDVGRLRPEPSALFAQPLQLFVHGCESPVGNDDGVTAPSRAWG